MFGSRARTRCAIAALTAVLPLAALACGGDVKVLGGDCITKQGSFDVGETFPAEDGCNTCTCEASGALCTKIACDDCAGAPPGCSQPIDPSCKVEASCESGFWSCEETCAGDCANAPPIDCLAPPDCFYDGPICVDNQLQCGELFCDEPECGPEPECPQPGNPDCFSYAICDGFSWSCITECVEPGSCEEKFPNGVQLVTYLITAQCGCVPHQACSFECQGDAFCEGAQAPGDACAACVTEASMNTEACVIDAAFGDDCQSDFECASYVDCVVNGG